MILSKLQLVDNITREIPDNSTASISPNDVRHNLLDIIDSVHVLTADQKLTALNFATVDTRTTRAGDLAIGKLHLDGYSSVDNSAFGYSALAGIYDGERNTAVGSYALGCNLYGDSNTAVGFQSSAGNIFGSGNVALGSYAIQANKHGDFNIAIGHGAGYYIGTDDSYKFFVGSHNVNEAGLCEDSSGLGAVPLMYGDLQELVLGVGVSGVHGYGTLQVAGDVSPSITGQHSLGHPKRRWENVYLSDTIDYPNDRNLSIQTSTPAGDLYTTDDIVFLGSGGHVGFGTASPHTTQGLLTVKGNVVPEATDTYSLGTSDLKWDGFFRNISVSGTANITDLKYSTIEDCSYACRTLYLASSGDLCSPDGPPCGYLTDEEIEGGGFVLQSSGTSYGRRDYEFTFRAPDPTLSCLEADTAKSRATWYSDISLTLESGRHIKTDRVIGRDNLTLINCHSPGYGIFIRKDDDTIRTGSNSRNEKQRITISNAAGGSFTLSFNGAGPTPPISYNAPYTTVQAALENLSTIGVGNVIVTGNSGGPWTVEFRGDPNDGGLAGQDLPEIVIDGSNLLGGATGDVSPVWYFVHIFNPSSEAENTGPGAHNLYRDVKDHFGVYGVEKSTGTIGGTFKVKFRITDWTVDGEYQLHDHPDGQFGYTAPINYDATLYDIIEAINVVVKERGITGWTFFPRPTRPVYKGGRWGKLNLDGGWYNTYGPVGPWGVEGSTDGRDGGWECRHQSINYDAGCSERNPWTGDLIERPCDSCWLDPDMGVRTEDLVAECDPDFLGRLDFYATCGWHANGLSRWNLSKSKWTDPAYGYYFLSDFEIIDDDLQYDDPETAEPPRMREWSQEPELNGQKFHLGGDGGGNYSWNPYPGQAKNGPPQDANPLDPMRVTLRFLRQHSNSYGPYNISLDCSGVYDMGGLSDVVEFNTWDDVTTVQGLIDTEWGPDRVRVYAHWADTEHETGGGSLTQHPLRGSRGIGVRGNEERPEVGFEGVDQIGGYDHLTFNHEGLVYEGLFFEILDDVLASGHLVPVIDVVTDVERFPNFDDTRSAEYPRWKFEFSDWFQGLPEATPELLEKQNALIMRDFLGAPYRSLYRSNSGNLRFSIATLVDGSPDITQDLTVSRDVIYVTSEENVTPDPLGPDSDIANITDVNFIASSGRPNDPYRVTYSSLESGVIVGQRLVARAGRKVPDTNFDPPVDNIVGFGIDYIDAKDEIGYTGQQKDRLTIAAYDDAVLPLNAMVWMRTSRPGLVGISDIKDIARVILPETIFNIQSTGDAVIRNTAGGGANSVIQLLTGNNTPTEGFEIEYSTSATRVDMSLFESADQKIVISLDNSNKFVGIHTVDPNELLTLSSGITDTATLSMQEQTGSAAATDSYGKVYVKPITGSASQTQSIYFLDDGGNEFDLTGGGGTSNAGTSIYADVQKNTHAGIDSPDSRDDIIDPNDQWRNTTYGHSALKLIEGGDDNLALGVEAGAALTTGHKNVFLGNYTAQQLETGSGNIVIGDNALNSSDGELSHSIIIGSDNTGQGTVTDYTFIMGMGTDPFLEGIMGPNVADRYLKVPKAKFSVTSNQETDWLSLAHNQDEPFGVDKVAGIIEKEDTVNDYPQGGICFNFKGTEGSNSMMTMRHHVAPMTETCSYYVPTPERPVMELKGDLNLKGNLNFCDGTHIDSTSGIVMVAGTGLTSNYDASLGNYAFHLDIEEMAQASSLIAVNVNDSYLALSTSGIVGKMNIAQLANYIDSGVSRVLDCYNHVLTDTSTIDTTRNCYNNYVGYQAGHAATGWTVSNFIGPLAGMNATMVNPGLATDSAANFIGHKAGYEAHNSDNSVFIGPNAGYQAANSRLSVFIGDSAGHSASSTRSIGIGDNALESVIGTNNLELTVGIGGSDTYRIIRGTQSNKINVGDCLAGDMSIKRLSVGEPTLDPNASLVIRAKDGDTTVRLQEWKKSDGTVVAYLDQNGDLYIDGTVNTF